MSRSDDRARRAGQGARERSNPAVTAGAATVGIGIVVGVVAAVAANNLPPGLDTPAVRLVLTLAPWVVVVVGVVITLSLLRVAVRRSRAEFEQFLVENPDARRQAGRSPADEDHPGR